MEGRANTLGIIGLGLMGGSAALRLRQEGSFERIIGYDINRESGLEAVTLGLVDELSSLAELSATADVIILAIPVNRAVELLPELLDSIAENTVVLDFGSTKEKICKVADRFPRRQQFVACHPIAGTENSGPSAAFATLFEHKVNIICDVDKSDSAVLQRVEEIMGQLGMRNKYMGSKDHDRHIAYVSHLSHISSFTLGKTVLEVEKDEKNIFDMAGSGFASTVRLAKSSPEMWAPIFTENADNIVEVLSAYINNLEEMKQQIIAHDTEKLSASMQKVNKIRTVLDGETIKL